MPNFQGHRQIQVHGLDVLLVGEYEFGCGSTAPFRDPCHDLLAQKGKKDSNRNAQQECDNPEYPEKL